MKHIFVFVFIISSLVPCFLGKSIEVDEFHQPDNTLASESLENDKTLASESLENDKTLASESLENNKTLASESLENDKTLASESLENDKPFASESLENDKTFASKSLENDNNYKNVSDVKSLINNEPENNTSEALPHEEAASKEVLQTSDEIAIALEHSNETAHKLSERSAQDLICTISDTSRRRSQVVCPPIALPRVPESNPLQSVYYSKDRNKLVYMNCEEVPIAPVHVLKDAVVHLEDPLSGDNFETYPQSRPAFTTCGGNDQQPRAGVSIEEPETLVPLSKCAQFNNLQSDSLSIPSFPSRLPQPNICRNGYTSEENNAPVNADIYSQIPKFGPIPLVPEYNGPRNPFSTKTSNLDATYDLHDQVPNGFNIDKTHQIQIPNNIPDIYRTRIVPVEDELALDNNCYEKIPQSKEELYAELDPLLGIFYPSPNLTPTSNIKYNPENNQFSEGASPVLESHLPKSNEYELNLPRYNPLHDLVPETLPSEIPRIPETVKPNNIPLISEILATKDTETQTNLDDLVPISLGENTGRVKVNYASTLPPYSQTSLNKGPQVSYNNNLQETQLPTEPELRTEPHVTDLLQLEPQLLANGLGDNSTDNCVVSDFEPKNDKAIPATTDAFPYTVQFRTTTAIPHRTTTAIPYTVPDTTTTDIPETAPDTTTTAIPEAVPDTTTTAIPEIAPDTTTTAIPKRVPVTTTTAIPGTTTTVVPVTVSDSTTTTIPDTVPDRTTLTESPETTPTEIGTTNKAIENVFGVLGPSEEVSDDEAGNQNKLPDLYTKIQDILPQDINGDNSSYGNVIVVVIAPPGNEPAVEYSRANQTPNPPFSYSFLPPPFPIMSSYSFPSPRYNTHPFQHPYYYFPPQQSFSPPFPFNMQYTPRFATYCPSSVPSDSLTYIPLLTDSPGDEDNLYNDAKR